MCEPKCWRANCIAGVRSNFLHCCSLCVFYFSIIIFLSSQELVEVKNSVSLNPDAVCRLWKKQWAGEFESVYVSHLTKSQKFWDLWQQRILVMVSVNLPRERQSVSWLVLKPCKIPGSFPTLWILLNTCGPAALWPPETQIPFLTPNS